MPEVTIAAELRTEFGKGAARRTRRAGRVPGVVYGHGAETKHVTLPGHELMLALKTQNALIRLDGLKGGSTLALPKAIQRDAIKGFVSWMLTDGQNDTEALSYAKLPKEVVAMEKQALAKVQ